MIKFCFTLITSIALGYAILGGYLAYDFAQGVRHDCVVPMTHTVRSLSESNTYLNSRVESALSVVRQLSTENIQLKNAVRVGAEMLQAQIKDNEELYDKIEDLEWRLEFLENMSIPDPDSGSS